MSETAKAGRTYPSDEEIVAGSAANGGLEGYSISIGVPPSSMRGYVKKREGLKAKIAEAVLAAKPISTERAAREIPTGEVQEEEKLRQRVQDLERALKRQRETEVLEERLVDALKDVVPRIEAKYNPNVVPTSDARGHDEHEMVLLFSDTHAGETVASEETLGMNEYDWDIMLRRMAKMQKSVLDFQENRPYKINKLYVWELGDMLSGDIHEELKVTNDRPMAEATVQFGYDAAEWLTGFVPHFEEIEVSGVPGNHPRATKKPSAKEAHNNGDWISYKIQEMLLGGNEKFKFNFPRAAYATTTVAEHWNCLLMHGDGIRSTMPGVPWGGVVRRITVLEQQFAQAKQPLDYIALGHFHTANALDGVGIKTFLNGSVKGMDEYSLRQFGSGRRPSQLLLTFHPKWGVTDVSYLDLEPVSPARS